MPFGGRLIASIVEYQAALDRTADRRPSRPRTAKLGGVRSWPLSCLLVAVACSSGGTWRRVETPHFVLHTNLSSSEARRAGIALETTRDALVSAAWPSFPFAAEKTEAYVLANGLDFERYFGKSTHGLFTRGKPPRFFLYGSAARWELRRTSHRPTPSVLRHEMVHQLGSEVWPRQPRWFSEGWAEFLEPIYYADDDNHVVVGALNYEALSWYRAIRTTKLTDALDWKRARRHAGGTRGKGPLRHQLALRALAFSPASGEARSNRRRALPRHGAGPGLADRMAELRSADADRELFQYQKYARFARFDQNVRPLIGTPVSEASLEQRLLEPREIEETKQLLAAVGEAHTGRSKRGDLRSTSTARAATLSRPKRRLRRPAHAPAVSVRTRGRGRRSLGGRAAVRRRAGARCIAAK